MLGYDAYSRSDDALSTASTGSQAETISFNSLDSSLLPGDGLSSPRSLNSNDISLSSKGSDSDGLEPGEPDTGLPHEHIYTDTSVMKGRHLGLQGVDLPSIRNVAHQPDITRPNNANSRHHLDSSSSVTSSSSQGSPWSCHSGDSQNSSTRSDSPCRQPCSQAGDSGQKKDHCYSGNLTKRGLSLQQQQTIKYGHLSNEHARLTEVLDNLHPEQVVNIIRRQLECRDSKAIVALGILLPRSRFPPLERCHCVRCHSTYNPQSDTSCLVPHPRSAVVQVAQGRDCAEFVCRLCQHRFTLKTGFYDESVSFYMSGFCYKGKHTSLTDDVQYGGAVQTCQQHGCVEVFL